MSAPWRVALYAAPGSGAAGAGLKARAEAWLGRSVDGTPVAQASAPGWTRGEIDAVTVDARRYGFHGTLKAPFRLAQGTDLDELDAAVAAFAAERSAAVIPDLTLTVLGGFVALVPGRRDEGLHALADEVVTRFDRFRAPPTAAESARRNPDAMPPRRRELTERWGYPYVLDEFAFHLTLTDRLAPERQPAALETLGAWFADDLGRDVPLDALVVFTEAEPGAPFALHAAHALRPDLPATAGTAAPEGAR